MTVNQAMFAEIHQLITEFPELHRQSSWQTDPLATGYCGTTRCVAGWAVWLAARDAGLLTRKREMTNDGHITELVIRLDVADEPGLMEAFDETSMHTYATLGAVLLNLDARTAHSLFMDMRQERVAARVKAFAETGEDLPLDEWDAYDYVN